MTWQDLTLTITTSFFYTYQLPRLFPDETQTQINSQLWRWTNQGKLIRLKQGLYIFSQSRSKTNLNEFTISHLLYQPSYVSLESVLNNYGIIPDIPWETTAINPLTTKKFQTPLGNYSFSKIHQSLFFGYRFYADVRTDDRYYLAEPEKALLDFIYVRKISDLNSIRITKEYLDKKLLKRFSLSFPKRIQKIIQPIL